MFKALSVSEGMSKLVIVTPEREGQNRESQKSEGGDECFEPARPALLTWKIVESIQSDGLADLDSLESDA